jgi:hypothetical protein
MKLRNFLEISKDCLLYALGIFFIIAGVIGIIEWLKIC